MIKPLISLLVPCLQRPNLANSRGPTRNYFLIGPPTHKLGASKTMGAIFSGEKSLRQCTHKSEASENLGAIFLRKKSACGNDPQVRGFQDLGTKKKWRAREAKPLGMEKGHSRGFRNSRGSVGRQPRSKNNFMYREPGFLLFQKYDIWCEMGSYCSVGARIRTGRSPMAQDHFGNPSRPQKGPWND